MARTRRTAVAAAGEPAEDTELHKREVGVVVVAAAAAGRRQQHTELHCVAASVGTAHTLDS